MNRDITVAVYGSLKQGFGNHVLLKGAECLGADTLTGDYAMVTLGGFPGVFATTDGSTATIVVELYKVHQDELWSLDCLEGHPDWYKREKIKTDNGTRAWVYLLDEAEYASYERVANGCW